MEANWDIAIASVLHWEGSYAIRANEPGGAVNMGVSLQTYREEHPGASIADLLAMTVDEAMKMIVTLGVVVPPGVRPESAPGA